MARRLRSYRREENGIEKRQPEEWRIRKRHMGADLEKATAGLMQRLSQIIMPLRVG